MESTEVNVHIPQNAKLKVLIFGYKEFSQLMSSVLGEYTDIAEFRIVDTIVDVSSEIQKHIRAFNPDVVVSAGSNARYLASSLQLPVVSLHTTEEDVYNGIVKAAKISKNIHVVSFQEHTIAARLAGAALNVNVEESIYLTPEQAREQFYLAANKPGVVIVGASLVCGLAASRDIPSFLVYSEASCQRTIDNALRAAKAWRRSNKDGALMSWLMTQSKTPILLIDEMDESLTLNNAAKAELNLTENVAQDLDSLIHPEGGKRESDGECEINGKEWWYHLDTVKQDVNTKFVYQLYSKQPKNKPHRPALNQRHTLIYSSKEMDSVVQQAIAFASSPSNVLLFGESGTGKELVARQIYKSSPYCDGKFIALNCSAIPSELFEGELFGHQDGAYTGSRRGGRKGLIEEAQGGALFLDEISELALDQQAKLLRFLQERRYRPLGGNQEKDVDLKLIAASNKSLKLMVERGEFREDLFYRLNVFNITLPPLRQRPSDIRVIALFKLTQLSTRYDMSYSAESLYQYIESAIESYTWPGNIRELENVLERVVAYVKAMKDIERLPGALSQIAPELNQNTTHIPSASGALKHSEQRIILEMLDRCSGDKRRAAQELGISQTTLWRRLKEIHHNNN